MKHAMRTHSRKDLRYVYIEMERWRREFIAKWKESGLNAVICPGFPSVAMPINMPQDVVLRRFSHTKHNSLDALLH